MTQKRFLGFLPAICLLALLPATAQAQTVTVGTANVEVGDVAGATITLDSDDQVQGIVVAAEWDGAVATGVGITTGAVLADADTVSMRVEADYAILGVVQDSDPGDNGGAPEVIPAGSSTLGTIDLEGTALGSSPITLVDDTYAMVDGGPTLSNIIVIGGLSIGVGEGLTLANGEVNVVVAPDKFIVESAAEGNSVRVLGNFNDEVEGFVVALCNDSGELLSIDVGSAASQADFSAVEIDPTTGGALGVVIDLVDPVVDPPNIQAGSGQHIATFEYSCTAGETVTLSFCDGAVGDPLKENLIVRGGLSITAADGLALEGGTLTCGQIVIPPEDCNSPGDEDGNGLADDDDPVCQAGFCFIDPETGEAITSVTAAAGASTDLCLGYIAPTEGDLGISGDGQTVNEGSTPLVSTQGFSLGLKFPCGAVSFEEDFNISGTILEEIGAEFIQVQADNSADDGDDCSLVVAVLVDALPPFEGGVIPGLADGQLLGCLTVNTGDALDCGESATICAEDGVNGRGKVPVRNLISVGDLPYRISVKPVDIIAGRGGSTDGDNPAPGGVFYRGDCNFTGRSGGLDPVEIADAAAVISFLFQTSIFQFNPPCLDACDANDDGRIDLADAIAILNYLFVPGSSFPPAPGPGFRMIGPMMMQVEETGPGGDPTEDPLDCEAGLDCDFF